MATDIGARLQETVDGEMHDLIAGKGRFAPDPYPDLTRDMAKIGYHWDVWRNDWIHTSGAALSNDGIPYRPTALVKGE